MLFIEKNFFKINASQYISIIAHSNKCTCKGYIPFAIYTPLIMAQDMAESTRETINHGRFINRFPLDIIKSIRQLERINKKYVNKKFQKCSIK